MTDGNRIDVVTNAVVDASGVAGSSDKFVRLPTTSNASSALSCVTLFLCFRIRQIASAAG